MLDFLQLTGYTTTFIDLNLSRRNMDITKWKSVAVKKSDYDLLVAVCDKKYRAPNAMISKLLHDYLEFQAKKNKISLIEFKKKLLNGNYKKQ